jgi:hypothetical protein
MLVDCDEPTTERQRDLLISLMQAVDGSFTYWATELRKVEDAERRAKWRIVEGGKP